MLERLNKLKGRSWAELTFRGRQAIAAFSERHGFSSQGRLVSDDELFRLFDPNAFSASPEFTGELLRHFRTQSRSKFFASFEEPTKTRALLQQHFSAESDSIVKQAESIIRGRFNLLGYRDLDFGRPIDWSMEPESGKRSPLVHWSRIDEMDSEVSGDKKIVWELNRHQYFATLGRAYWFTGDERYAETFSLHLSQWMDQNPPKLGLNWVSSLEVSFRAISWLWAMHFFKYANQLTPELYKRALKFLYIHARHLETYLSTYSSPNTHLTGEALGLFYLGTTLSEFREAERWRRLGKFILLDELSRHVLPDGVYFERASYYHRYTCDFYTHFLILSERNGEAIGDEAKGKVQSLLDHLMYITRPDGTTPFLGDDDGGRLAMLDSSEVNDFRSLLSTGAAAFRRMDYKYVAGEASESTLWLMGNEGLQTFEQLSSVPPESQSRAFPDGGYYIMRDGWSNDSNYLLFDCGPHGALTCGHSHADALSFELAARGRTLLVDAGTFTYTGSQELRDSFRSSAQHNTLTIDGESSSVSDGPFSWKETADASIIAWKNGRRFDFLRGMHDGYKRLRNGPARHTRSVLFLKNDYWLMHDRVETDGSHEYGLHFHFDAVSHPDLEQTDGHVVSPVENAFGTSGLQIFSFTDNGAWRVEDGWVSACYGTRLQAPVCTFSTVGTGRRDFYSFLVPRRANEARVIVREVDAIGGHAFEILGDGTYDLLLAGDGSLTEVDRITTDFRWAWARFGDDAETIEELVLIDGQAFSLDGQEVIESTHHIDYVIASREGDKLRLDVDGRLLEVEWLSAALLTASSVRERKPNV